MRRKMLFELFFYVTVIIVGVFLLIKNGGV